MTSIDFESLKLGVIFTVMQQKLASPLPLRGTTVSGKIDGPVASVTVTQRFANPYTEVVELEYLFPLPHEAAITDYEIRIGERVISAQIKEAEAARRTYEQAIESGKRASLLEQRRPNLFSIRIGNVQPGEEIVTVLQYQERQHYQDGYYEFVFPMGITPKYHTADTSPAEAESVSAPIADDTQVAPVEISLDVDAGVAVGDPVSPSHEITLERADDCRFSLTLAGENIPNKDFVLRYTVSSDHVRAGVWASADDDLETVLISILPPRLSDETEKPAPREFVYVLDRSGSMRGGPIAQARAALIACLKELNPDDTFYIEVFDTVNEWFAREAKQAISANIKAAEKWLGGIDARGGTEILGAIEEALKLPIDRERQRYLVFLTDGAVSAEDRAITLVNKQRQDARIFTFGIGPSVNRALLTKMAEMGRGAVDFIGLNESIEQAIERFRKYVRFPAMQDIELEWQGAENWDTYPAQLPDLYIGQPLEVVTRLKRTVSGDVLVNFKGTLKGETVTVSTSIPVPAASNPVLKRIWARRRVDSLLDEQYRGGDREKIRSQVISLALDNRLVTPFTSFVAVDSEIVETPEGGPQQVKISTPLPDGLDIEGFGLGLQAPMYGAALSSVGPARSRAMGAMPSALASFRFEDNAPEEKSRGIGLPRFLRRGARSSDSPSHVDDRSTLLLVLREKTKHIECEIPADHKTVTVGLRDSQSGHVPDVDLLIFGGREKGVSIKHATIIRKDDALYIIDESSENGTFLNDQKLVAGQSYVLKDGDKLRLGSLELEVHIV